MCKFLKELRKIYLMLFQKKKKKKENKRKEREERKKMRNKWLNVPICQEKRCYEEK